MPTYEVTIPGAGKFRIESQSELDDGQVFRIASGQADMQRMSDPTTGMSFTDKFNAGMGKAFTDIGRGASQLIGMGPSAAETRETRQLDAPLMGSGAGLAGNVAGNIAMLAPLAVAPGGATVAGAGAAGLVAGGLQPTENPQQRLTNMAVGGGLGAGTQALAGPVAQRLGEAAAGRQSAMQAKQAQNAVRDKTLADAQAAGFKVAPTTVNDTALNRALEKIGGKTAIKQEAQIANQDLVAALSRKEAGLSPTTPLSRETLENARNVMAEPYRQIEALPPQALTSPPFRSASDTLKDLRQSRADSNRWYQFYDRSANPSALSKAQRLGNKAEMYENSLEAVATQSGKPDLVDALRDARQRMAKNFDVERALNVGSGIPEIRAYGSALDRNKPLSGDLAMMGRFAEAFQDFAPPSRVMSAPGVSALEPYASAGMGMAGSAATGHPAGLLAAGIPLLRGPARSLVLSDAFQKSMAKPDYSVGAMTRGAAALGDPETRRRAALLARGLALPAVPELAQ